jgi:subtilisin family serine protease
LLARLLACTGIAALALAAGGTASAAPAPDAAAAPPDVRVHTALTPNDPFFASWLWPAELTGLQQAWDATLGDPSVTIAVLDTGVSQVPDLDGALLPGIDLVNNDADASDDNGHGTEVASVAAARTNNGVGIAGVCGRCSILPVKVLGADGSGFASTVARGIAWAVDHGARVVNLSAAGVADDPTLDAAIRDAVARGVVVVVAAGNAGSADPAAGGYPAASAPDAIRVGGVDRLGALFPWSNRGSWVDVGAPGALAAATKDSAVVLGAQGTSLASPVVAGIAGLLLSYAPTLAPAAVKSLVVSSGPQVAGLDVASGRVVDAAAALAAAGWTAPKPKPQAVSRTAVRKPVTRVRVSRKRG